jgi:signal transduction histidine kinase
MRRSLSLKLAAGYLIFGVLSFLFIALVTARLTYYRVVERRASDLRNMAGLISDMTSGSYGAGGGYGISSFDQFDTLSFYSGLRIWFITPDGTITYDSHSGSKSSLTGQTIPDFDPADTGKPYRIGSFYGVLSDEYLSVSVPMIRNFRTIGYVVIHEPTLKLSRTSDSLLLPTYLTFLVIYCFSFIILILIRVFVTNPLKTITKGADEFARGNLKHKIEIHTSDEMGYLAETLNFMASELAVSEEYQRKFIANVSHDFRSPLTSIRGYLVAFEDGTIPPELQGKYIRVILGETERLTKLTESMLSINALEQNKMLLNLSDFDIKTIIRGTCETFEGVCSSRNITFDLFFSDEDTTVRADMGRIQQVVYNLLDNAIKFSPDNSVIEISVYRRNNVVFVSVKDHGIGISKEDIKKIWTRFYKTDQSRGKDKKGTGLGLSIVKDIIDAHHTTIDVVSTLDIGTEFTFRLPMPQPDQA